MFFNCCRAVSDNYTRAVVDSIFLLFGSSMGHSENLETVIFNVRLPRVITAMVVGAALSIAGASYQGMFKNPLVSPDILGHLLVPDLVPL